jgi:hypothetical protein
MRNCEVFMLAIIAIGTTRALAATTQPTSRPSEKLLSPYSPDPNHLWNRLHRALFLRTAPDGSEHIHTLDPLLYHGGKYLLQGEPYQRAIAMLEEFIAAPREQMFDDPRKRLCLQCDLWAAFDYVAWYPDEWVHFAKDEPAAVALRDRLAKAIARLALDDHKMDALPDNYALAVKSNQFASDCDPAHPEKPFLPANLLDPNGPWVRYHDTLDGSMAQQHDHAVDARAVHIVFMRLPGGRAATQDYLKHLNRDSIPQFPQGTMVAMVRRAEAIDRAGKVRVTPVTELVQMRVYRRIPTDPQANFHGDLGIQDVYEFTLNRPEFFAGEPGLLPVKSDAPGEAFARDSDPFIANASRNSSAETPIMETCTMCHQAPGVHSVLSLQRGLRADPKWNGPEMFRTYDWNVELSYTSKEKIKRYDWGLLQGLMEAARQPASHPATSNANR